MNISWFQTYIQEQILNISSISELCAVLHSVFQRSTSPIADCRSCGTQFGCHVMCVCVCVCRIHFLATQSRHSICMPIYMHTATNLLSTKQGLSSTIRCWINISRSEYATHVCKENLFYRHAFAYQYDINDSTLPNILDSPFRNQQLQNPTTVLPLLVRTAEELPHKRI